MNLFLRVLIVSTLLTGFSVSAQDDLSGTWEGDLMVAPDQQIGVQFTLERAADGSWSGTLNAPDQPSLTDVPIDAVHYEQGNLTLEVSAVSGTYQGTVVAEGIEGTWSQQGTSFELNLAPYQEPVLTAAGFARISGSWIGTLRPVPGGELEFTVVVRFEEDEQDGYRGFLSVPDQGGNNIPIDTIRLDDAELTLTISQAGAEIAGSLTEEGFTGKWNQGGQSLDLSLARGEYEQQGLNLTALHYARLRGPWHGQVSGLTVVLRVEESDGRYLAFMDSPDQGASDIPVPALEVDGDQLTFSIAAISASFSGRISADEITGDWSQGPQPTPLTLVRGPYVPGIDLPEAVQQRLRGTWKGTVNDTELVFRFEADEAGNFGAFLDIPGLGASGLPLSGIIVGGDNLQFNVAGIGAQFSGTLSSSEVRGTWTRAGSANTLVLGKE